MFLVADYSPWIVDAWNTLEPPITPVSEPLISNWFAESLELLGVWKTAHVCSEGWRRKLNLETIQIQGHAFSRFGASKDSSLGSRLSGEGRECAGKPMDSMQPLNEALLKIPQQPGHHYPSSFG